MITIGITGNIGSGKTTLSKLFDSKNTYLFNADKEAKKHLKKHSVLQRKIISIFGNMILTGTELDFKKLAEVAFKNQKNQKILNGIIWPEVSLLIESALRDAKKNKYNSILIVSSDYHMPRAKIEFERFFKTENTYYHPVNSNNDVNAIGKIKKLFLEYIKYMRTYISLAVGL